MSLPKPVVGVTMGDPNGIGPELVLKLFSEPGLQELCTPVIYGSNNVLQHYKAQFGMAKLGFVPLSSDAEPQHRKLNLADVSPDFEKIEPGVVSPEAGSLAYLALDAAVADLKSGRIDVLITLPIHKAAIHSEQFKFAGHTEYLAQQFEVQDPLMLLTHQEERLRVALVTVHIPLRDVAARISADRVLARLRTLHKSLKIDFGIARPKIAVLGLNPHAGDGGLIGSEEQKVLQQVFQRATKEKIMAVGPYPADGFFARATWRKFDAVLAMYHDQGLVPFKTLAHGGGVNFTAGLPVVRTSPDHGTAFDIAGRGIADPTSAREALYLAIDIFRRRLEFQEVLAGRAPSPGAAVRIAELMQEEDAVLTEDEN